MLWHQPCQGTDSAAVRGFLPWPQQTYWAIYYECASLWWCVMDKSLRRQLTAVMYWCNRLSEWSLLPTCGLAQRVVSFREELAQQQIWLNYRIKGLWMIGWSMQHQHFDSWCKNIIGLPERIFDYFQTAFSFITTARLAHGYRGTFLLGRGSPGPFHSWILALLSICRSQNEFMEIKSRKLPVRPSENVLSNWTIGTEWFIQIIIK